MRIVPTRRFWWLLAGGVPLALLGAWAPGMEQLLLPYDALLFLALFVSPQLIPKPTSLVCRRETDAVLSVRVQNLVRLTLINDSSVPIKGRLRDEPPAEFDRDRDEFAFDLGPNREQLFRYHVRPRTRGDGMFRGTFIRLLAPLGLAEVEYRLPSDQPVRVYPNVQALREFDLLKQKGKLNQMGIRRTRIRGLGTEFESLREYNPDDDYRRIDWKSTARQGKLVVREYEQERNQSVILCIDAARHMLGEVDGVSKLDHALDASLMLMHAATVAGDHVGLLVYADVLHRYIPPKKGRGQTGAILDTVHALHAEPVEPNHTLAYGYLQSRWKRRSLVVLFTDAEDEAQARSLGKAIGPLLRRHLVMVVRVSDPRLAELTNLRIDGPRAMYKRAAALWYNAGRSKAEAQLSALGIQSIEAEPQELSAALVGAYLKVKAENRL